MFLYTLSLGLSKEELLCCWLYLFLISIMYDDAILSTLQNWSLLWYFITMCTMLLQLIIMYIVAFAHFQLFVLEIRMLCKIDYVTGSTWCIWYVQKFEFIGHATYKKRWSSDDVLLFWSCDPKRHIPAYSTGIVCLN